MWRTAHCAWRDILIPGRVTSVVSCQLPLPGTGTFGASPFTAFRSHCQGQAPSEPVPFQPPASTARDRHLRSQSLSTLQLPLPGTGTFGASPFPPSSSHCQGQAPSEPVPFHPPAPTARDRHLRSQSLSTLQLPLPGTGTFGAGPFASAVDYLLAPPVVMPRLRMALGLAIISLSSSTSGDRAMASSMETFLL